MLRTNACRESTNIEEQRPHLGKIESCEEIEAIIDSAAVCCVLTRDMCNDVSRYAESWRGMMFKTARGQNIARAGIKTVECSIEGGFAKRLTRAVTAVQKIFSAVSGFAETAHQFQFTRTRDALGKVAISQRT